MENMVQLNKKLTQRDKNRASEINFKIEKCRDDYEERKYRAETNYKDKLDRLSTHNENMMDQSV